MAVITGIGCVSPFGRGTTTLWDAMAAGRCGIGPMRRFDPAEVGVAIAGMLHDRNTPAHGESSSELCIAIALEAARDAWTAARLERVAPERIAFVFGSSLGDRFVKVQEITERVGDVLGVGGPRLTISTACTSATNAIGLGLDLLALRSADVVIAGGADILSRLVLSGFAALGVLSETPCAPFGVPSGTTLGEGAGFLVLERDASRAPAAFSVVGYGLSADAFHDTGPDPSGAGIARSLRGAIVHAGVAPDAIDYINAHGTGTPANDPAEWRAIQQVLGPRATSVPVSSSKSFLGHAQGAAGALETIATLVAMEHGTIPPTHNVTERRPNTPPDVVAQSTPREATCDVALCTNSAFGGANCAIVVARGHVARPTPRRRRVSLLGIGAVGPHGTDLAALASPSRGRVPDFAFEAIAPTIDPRGFDASTRYLVASVALAFRDASFRLRSDMRDRAGIVFGVVGASDESDAKLQRFVDTLGYRGVSAALFSRQVLNAPAGSASKLFGLRGAMSTICANDATGLAAVAYAAELLAAREDNDVLLASSLDELPVSADPTDRSEGAATALLSTSDAAIRVAGWGFAGPRRLDEAKHAALAMAELPGADLVVEPRDAIALVGASPAYASAMGLVIGALAIRSGRARTVLIAASGGASADCAVVLAGGDHAK